ncbi:hypothetical protein OG612_00775 [Streptomyces sp. NBC_01527]|uniref:hypothetical protein n=1 Tax=Streptomyces sp. NBC_01527 TaxID=2903894 RepID=UPI00386BF970
MNGAAYTTATGAFNDRYQPTSTTATIPSAAGGLAGTYTWTYGYNPETGALLWTLNPAVGDIPSERVTGSPVGSGAGAVSPGDAGP